MQYKVEGKIVYWRNDKMDAGKWLVKETCKTAKEAEKLLIELQKSGGTN